MVNHPSLAHRRPEGRRIERVARSWWYQSGIRKPSISARGLRVVRVFLLSKPNRESRRADSNRCLLITSALLPLFLDASETACASHSHLLCVSGCSPTFARVTVTVTVSRLG